MKNLVHLLFILTLTATNLQGQYRTVFTSLDKNVLLKSLFTSSTVIKNKAGEAMARWKPSLAESLKLPVNMFGECFTQIDTIIRYKDDDGKQYALVAFGSYAMNENNDYESDCFNCAPTLGAASFAYGLLDRPEWTIISFDVSLTEHGLASDMREINLVQIGKSKFAMELPNGYALQGYLGTWLTYYEIGSFDKIFSIITHEDNLGVTDDESKRYNFDVEVKIVPTTDNYFKIVATSSGTQAAEDWTKIIPAESTRTFYFDDFAGMYVEKKE